MVLALTPLTRRSSLVTASVTSIAAISIAAGLSVPAAADDQGVVNTASVEWSSADSGTAVWTGGAPVEFDPREAGWSAGAFSSIGQLGLARTITGTPSDRQTFSSFNETVTLSQGDTLEMDLYNVLRMNTFQHIDTDVLITAKGNSLRYVIDLSNHYPQSLPGKRLFWNVDFAAGSDVVYEQPDSSTLIATDSTGTHATVVLHIATDHGEALWAGRDLHTDPLSSGTAEATGYVRDITQSPVTATIHAFVLDYDPCAADAALETAHMIAQDPASWFGQTIPVHSGCLTTTEWDYLTGQDTAQQLEVTLDDAVVDPDGSTRRYALSDLPDFLSASIDDTVTPAIVSLESVADEVTGNYTTSLRSWRETDIDGATVRSAPLRSSITLTVSDPPPPPPEPEPEPAPEPEPVLDEEVPQEPDLPEVAPEPTPEPEPAPVSNTRGSRDDDDDDEDIEVALTLPAPPPPAPLAPQPVPQPEPEPEVTVAPTEDEPDFQFQESAPPTPLPATPQLPETTEAMSSPEVNLWRSLWWVWVAGGLGLLGTTAVLLWRKPQSTWPGTG